MADVEGPDGTVYELPDVGDEVKVTVDARVDEISEADGRAPVVVFNFEPATDRLTGFQYAFYPWEIEIGGIDDG